MGTAMKLCSVDDCSNPVLARGLCNRHWIRLRKYGSPTAGGTAKGAGATWIRDVALAYEGDECLIYPFNRMNTGYAQCVVDGDRVLVHRYVCGSVHGPAPHPRLDAAHSCGNGHLGCATKKHLRWATRSENMIDAVNHGARLVGEKHHWAKVADSDIPAIIALRATTSLSKIAEKYGVSEGCIYSILSGKTRRHNVEIA